MVNFSVEGVGFSDFHFHIIYQQFLKAIETRELFSSRHKILEIVKFVITGKKTLLQRSIYEIFVCPYHGRKSSFVPGRIMVSPSKKDLLFYIETSFGRVRINY